MRYTQSLLKDLIEENVLIVVVKQLAAKSFCFESFHLHAKLLGRLLTSENHLNLFLFCRLFFQMIQWNREAENRNEISICW